MATTAVNGVDSTNGSASGPSLGASRKQQPKNNYGNKNVDGNRKQNELLSDSSQNRRNPTQKVWNSGINPITQRSNTPSQQNGVSGSIKNAQKSTNLPQESPTPDQHANDRLLFLFGNMIGLMATITIKSGNVFSGVFVGFLTEASETAYQLKMVKQLRSGSSGDQDDEGDYIGVGEDHAVSFEVKDVATFVVDNVSFDSANKLQNGPVSGFRTDTDISGNIALRERDLQPWEPSTVDPGMDLSLESETVADGSWDQFAANKQLFGLESNYDEHIYTTRIDKSNPLYDQRLANAEKLVKEIESGATTNSHMREERGLSSMDEGLDEESRYSGVRRNGADYPPLQSSTLNRYTPPARRAPTAQPTVAGAPFDDSIISSQIARPSQKADQPQKSTKEDLTKIDDRNSTETKPLPDLPYPISNAVSMGKESVPKGPVSSGSSKVPLPIVQKATDGPNTTANVETALLDSFRQFSVNEKAKFQEHRRDRVSKDKAVRLNDLKKFSKDFKLLSPVPKDLVPILAKDKSKQDEIMENSKRIEEQALSAPPNPATHTNDPKAQRPLAAARYGNVTSPVAKAETQNQSRNQGLPPTAPQNMRAAREYPRNGNANQPGTNGGLLAHRLADSHTRHKVGGLASIPTPLPIQDPRMPSKRSVGNGPLVSSPQHSSSVRSPSSAVSAKFNVQAMEFKPNPAASSFKPVANPSVSSSPRSNSIARPLSRTASPSAFFGQKRPIPPQDRPSILENFNPLKRLKEETEADGRTNEYALNGGIKPAYKTPPTWNPPKDGEEWRSYKDAFGSAPSSTNAATPRHSSPVNPPLPHQHQLPLHLQSSHNGIPQVHTQHQTPLTQHHHYPNGPHEYNEHRMQASASQSSMYSSPRLQHSNVAYPAPMPPQSQLAYNQHIPQYVVGHNVAHPAHLRGPYPGGPPMLAPQGPQFAAPMMVQQPSGGGFVGVPQGMAIPINPQISMYPGQTQQYGGPSQPPVMYGSPGRGAPLMMHSGSHQGQHPQMFTNGGQYGQPIYAQQQPPHMMSMRAGYGSPQPGYHPTPHPQHHYPPQPHRIPSSSYGQLPQAPQHVATQSQQQQQQPSAPNDAGEEGR